MNPLMHVTFTLKVLEHAGIKKSQQDIVLGSVLPDISILGIIPEYDAHKKGVAFLDYLSHNEPALKPFGVGWVLHGEEPECLDFHVHKKNGYIDKNKQEVLELSKKHKIEFEGVHNEVLAHTLIEFACDSLAEKETTKILKKAFKQADLEKISYHIAKFYCADQKRVLKILKFFKHFNFNKLRTMHGIAHTMQDFMFYIKFADKNARRKDLTNINWLKACKYLWTRINTFKTHRIISLLKEVREVVKEDCHTFLEETKIRISAKVVKKTLGEYL